MYIDSFMNCNFTYNLQSNIWYCPDCNDPLSKKSICHRQLCRLPPKRECKAKLTPEQLAQREAARAEQEKLTAEECEALRPEGEKLGWTPAMIKTYSVALAGWIKAGRPIRSDEEVSTIIIICENCDKYNKDKQRCSVCGCKINTSNLAIFNKARMGTQNCPIQKW